MPVIRSGNDDCVDASVVKQPAEIAVGLNPSTNKGGCLVEPAPVDLGEGDHVDVGLAAEVEDMTLADQPEADEPDPDAVIRSKDAGVGGGRQR
jgi:hypothetical protein